MALSARVNLILTCILALPCVASDWPQWHGPARTGLVPEGEKVPTELPAELKPVWKLPCVGGFASPVVAAGKLFYLDDDAGTEIVHAVNAEDGKEFWKVKLFASHKDGFGMGPRCTPLVDGDRLYVQSCKGEFQCLSVVDGKVIWRKNFVDDFGAIFIGEKGQAAGGSRHGNSGSPVIEGDAVIVQVGSAKGASIVAFKKTTGDVIWKAENDQTAYAPPMVATLAGVKQVVSFTAEALIGLNIADGKLLWRVPMKTALGRHVTTPLIFNDTVTVASHQIGLICTQISKDGDALKATEAWAAKEMKINFSSPVSVGEHLYGVGPAKNLVCIELKTGKIAWEKSGLFTTPPDKVHASFIVMGKNILMLNDGGQLVFFAADPAEYKEISKVQACGLNWCSPAYVGGKLYLRDNKELYCLNLLK